MLSQKMLKMILVLLVLIFPRVALADWAVSVGVGGPDHDHWDHDHYHWHDHPGWGYHEHYLGPDCYNVWTGGIRYAYCDGLYYTYAGGGDYILVNPPVGAYVTSIPPDFQAVIINGRTYYTSDGVYYRLTDHGYKVVPTPVVYEQPVVVQPAPVVVQPAPVPPGSFTINVPNNSGGYTAVVIRSSGAGYVGPQGEFYANFPSVAQLKAMYGK